MDEELIQLLGSCGIIEKLLAVLAFLSAVVLGVYNSFSKTNREFITKFSGALLVSALALLANHVVVYALSIFIVATIITRLDFLENIAAIFWGRREFWEYRTYMTKATKAELRDKLHRDVQREVEPGTPSKEVRNIRIQAVEFERLSIDTIGSEDGIFEKTRVRSGVRIMVEGLTYVIDAVAVVSKGAICFYVIEIKLVHSRHTVPTSARQLQQYMHAYEAFVEDHEPAKPVRGILIIPSNIESENFIGDRIGVLKFDMQTRKFTNKNIISEWIYGNEKKDWNDL